MLRSPIEVLEQVNMNNFILVSKNVSLFHFYNVMQPLASEPRVLDCIKEANFDDTLFQHN